MERHAPDVVPTHPTNPELVASTPVFTRFERGDRERLARTWDECDIRQGEILVTEGVVSVQSFVIVDGWATVTVAGQTVAVVGHGSLVGDAARRLHSAGGATVTALTPMRVLVSPPNWARMMRELDVPAAPTSWVV